jgi:hypothetical protein
MAVTGRLRSLDPEKVARPANGPGQRSRFKWRRFAQLGDLHEVFKQRAGTAPDVIPVHLDAILTGSSADPTGRGRGLLDLGSLPDGVRGVILFGIVSGTIIVRYTP